MISIAAALATIVLKGGAYFITGSVGLRSDAFESLVNLLAALIVLVAMSLAGLALMRGVDTGTLIASNLAFKQSATAAGDLGVVAGGGGVGAALEKIPPRGSSQVQWAGAAGPVRRRPATPPEPPAHS